VYYPALKMRWVEGLSLNQFVEEHLERPNNLKMLLDLWVKLAARLRESQIAHADLQHGNVILVPMSGGTLGLRLIDYDGMYVPPGEVGHPCYQHPQRIREGLYNADVDRFSHLVIYTAIRCLVVGRSGLWQRFNTGENLLFRDSDFRRPEASELVRTLWQMSDAPARPLVGRLILACRRPLEQVALLQDIVDVDGQVLPLSGEEADAVEAVLGSEAPPAATPLPQHTSAAPAPKWLADASDQDRPTGTSSATEPTTTPIPPASAPPRSPVAPVQTLHPVLAALAGQRHALRHNLLRAAVVWLALLVIGLGAKVAFFPSGGGDVATTDAPAVTPAPIGRAFPSGGGDDSTTDAGPPLRLCPIPRQVAEWEKPLTFAVTVEGADHWAGKLRFGLGTDAPSDATIDAWTGVFSWTPRVHWREVDEHEFWVTVEGPEGQKDQTVFAVVVVQSLRLAPMGDQTVEAGKPLTVTVSPRDPEQWAGKIRFCLASAPPRATIDAQTGVFTWMPDVNDDSSNHDVAVSVEGPEGQKDQTRFSITVTNPSKSEPAKKMDSQPQVAAAALSPERKSQLLAELKQIDIELKAHEKIAPPIKMMVERKMEEAVKNIGATVGDGPAKLIGKLDLRQEGDMITAHLSVSLEHTEGGSTVVLWSSDGEVGRFSGRSKPSTILEVMSSKVGQFFTSLRKAVNDARADARKQHASV
jgi:hypothetical protein